ncbi:MAG: hypothetical protein HQM02_04895 [Magnetococcales bacterium]|nr:hypothetical protein [Magnetococcales bacterium]
MKAIASLPRKKVKKKRGSGGFFPQGFALFIAFAFAVDLQARLSQQAVFRAVCEKRRRRAMTQSLGWYERAFAQAFCAVGKTLGHNARALWTSITNEHYARDVAQPRQRPVRRRRADAFSAPSAQKKLLVNGALKAKTKPWGRNPPDPRFLFNTFYE